MAAFVQPKKAIVLAAGSGTRFLPQTKAMAKEMLPVLDKPIIQWIIEDLVSAGVEDIICVITPEKDYIEKHFLRNEKYEQELMAKKGKEQFAEAIKKAGSLANFSFIFQEGQPKGNARPVLNAKDLLTPGEPFFVFSADDIFRCPKQTRAQQLLEAYKLTGKTTICLQEVETKMVDKYGMVVVGKEFNDKVVQVKQVIEKPGAANTPSNLASMLGYILAPEILPIIAEEKVDKAGEITLADSISELAENGGEVYGVAIDGVYHDMGNPTKYLEGVIDFALHDERFADDIRAYIEKSLK